MPDYSDEEIDKISDDVSESEDTSEGKQRKLKETVRSFKQLTFPINKH